MKKKLSLSRSVSLLKPTNNQLSATLILKDLNESGKPEIINGDVKCIPHMPGGIYGGFLCGVRKEKRMRSC
jgi:hypothetical protein